MSSLKIQHYVIELIEIKFLNSFYSSFSGILNVIFSRSA